MCNLWFNYNGILQMESLLKGLECLGLDLQGGNAMAWWLPNNVGVVLPDDFTQKNTIIYYSYLVYSQFWCQSLSNFNLQIQQN